MNRQLTLPRLELTGQVFQRWNKNWDVDLAILLLLFIQFRLFVVFFQLAKALHGPQIGLRAAWIYVLLFFPMCVTVTWFDTMPLFFLLLTAWLTLKGHARFAGAAAGIGFMVKVVPILAVPMSLQSIRKTSGRKGRSHLWVIVDHNADNAPMQGRMLSWLDGWGSRASNDWFEKYELIDYASTAQH